MTRLTVRRRLLLALTLAVFAGYVWVAWSLSLGEDIVRHVVDHQPYPTCSSTRWHDVGVDCDGNPSVPQQVLTLLGVAAVVFGAGVLVARWVARPMRGLAATVARLGSQNLGERAPLAGRDEMGLLARETNAMLDRLVEAYESQRRFAANASHELLTPLALQRALIEVGMSELPSREQNDLLARQLLDANRRNEELVEGLLVLAETDRGLVSRTPQRLDAVARAVCDRYADAAGKAGVELRTALAPTTVTGEEVMLERLVSNLIANGLKYNVAGGCVEVQVTADPDPSVVVENTGPPVAAELVPLLFEPFRRGQGERLDTRAGSGLGLTIVRSVAAAHGAAVHAQPGRAGGLRVDVRFAR